MMVTSTRFLLVDATGAGSGIRGLARDVIGSGARVIAGVLEKMGGTVKIMVPESFFEARSRLSEFDVLMCGGMSMDIPAMTKIARIWKRWNGGVCIAGGPASLEAEKLLQGGYDLVLVGEAEDTVADLFAKGLSDGKLPDEEELRRIHGVSFTFKTSGSFCSGVRRTTGRWEPSVERIKDYPLYKVARVYVWCVRGCSNFYRTRIPLPDGRRCVECGRCTSGPLKDRLTCPANIPPGCGYCSVPNVYGPPRSRDVESILSEVEGLLEQGVRRIYLGASCFLDFHRDERVGGGPLSDPRNPEPNYDRIEELLSNLKDLAGSKVYVSVENAKPCLFTEEAASIISEYLPGSTIHLGGETGDMDHASALGRPSTPSETLGAVSLAVKKGLRPYVYFIHGLPGQTLKSARKTVKMMREVARLGAEKITVYRFKPLPMSAFEGFKEAPPATRSKAGGIIVREAIKINRAMKKKLVGKVIDVVVAEKGRGNFKDRLVGYPLREGPTIILSGATSIGDIVRVRVTNILGDKLVEGNVLNES
ncbi:MAG: radical SAM protein [Candidatus Freyarchaeota archaeon]|nr:radical SAM protein [Candidatus Jordarchaeia archaeon]